VQSNAWSDVSRPGGRGPSSPTTRLWPATGWGRLLLVFPVFCAALTVAIMLYLSGVFDPTFWSGATSTGVTLKSAGLAIFGVVAVGYNLLAPLALAGLIVLAERLYPRGMFVVSAGCLVYTAATVWSLTSMISDESSTAVLLLLFLPAYLAGLLVPFGLAAALVHKLRSRRIR